MNVITLKLKEVLYSVLPITVLVLILNFTYTPLGSDTFVRFIIGAFLIIIGLTVFLTGVDVGISSIGNYMGKVIAKSNKIWFVIIAGLVLGFFISIAEPDLHILAGQVEMVTSNLISKFSIVVVVSIGIAVLLTAGLLRIVFNFPTYKLMTILYGSIFIMAFFVSAEYLAISFDASGATTGALTVPFMLALALGVSRMKKDSKVAEEDSFGLVGIASTGAIIGVMGLNIFSGLEEMTGSLPLNNELSTSLIAPFFMKFPIITGEVFAALIPLLVIFLLMQFTSHKLSINSIRKTMFGVLYTFVGLVLFLVGVNAGFMEAGSRIGYALATENSSLLVVVGFVLGLVTILAEPAVHVLTNQIEDVTSGYVNRKTVLVSLSIGVGVAVAMSMIRILVPGISLWHYLLPGFGLSVVLSYIVPKLFVGMAFDSGGVASGPMTATFILAYAQGAAESLEGANVLVDGFGVIAIVAMTPIIALQTLGFIYKIKSKKGGL